MPTVSHQGDRIEIYYNDWGSGQPIPCSSHGWPLSSRRAGTRRCCSFSTTVFASSPMTAAATAVRPQTGEQVTIWITMPTNLAALTCIST